VAAGPGRPGARGRWQFARLPALGVRNGGQPGAGLYGDANRAAGRRAGAPPRKRRGEAQAAPLDQRSPRQRVLAFDAASMPPCASPLFPGRPRATRAIPVTSALGVVAGARTPTRSVRPLAASGGPPGNQLSTFWHRGNNDAHTTERNVQARAGGQRRRGGLDGGRRRSRGRCHASGRPW